MRELAFLNSGLTIKLIDETSAKPKIFENKYDGGVAEFVQFIDQKKSLYAQMPQITRANQRARNSVRKAFGKAPNICATLNPSTG